MNWKRERAVVTGACGFIGSHLTEALVRLGAKTTALSLYDARGSHGWLDDLPTEIRGQLQIRSGDVRDSGFVQNLIRKGDIVFHLAALIGIPYSYHAPRSYLDTNALGSLNILEAARLNKAKRVLIVSTSEVYGSALTAPISENHPLQAQSPYAASKIAAEKLAESYHRSFGLPVTVARPFNTFGPRQSPRAVIPTILMQMLDGARSIRLGDPSTTRDFNYVEDTVTGMLKLAACGAAEGLAVNIGTGTETAVSDVIRAAEKITGRKISVKPEASRIRPDKSEVRRLCADNALLRRLTGWAPSSRLGAGLRLTADWIAKHRQYYQAERYYI